MGLDIVALVGHDAAVHDAVVPMGVVHDAVVPMGVVKVLGRQGSFVYKGKQIN